MKHSRSILLLSTALTVLILGSCRNTEEKINLNDSMLSTLPVVKKCPPSLQPFRFECALYQRYISVKNILKNDYAVDITYLKKYRATRFIGNYSWGQHQKDKGNSFAWLVYEPSPDTWMTWERGARFIQNPPFVQKHKFTSEIIRNIHLASITSEIMKNTAKWFKDAEPGKLRTTENGVRSFATTPSFSSQCIDWNPITESIKNLLTNYDLKGVDGESLVRSSPVSCKKSIRWDRWSEAQRRKYGNKYFGTIKYTHTNRVLAEFNYLLNYINKEWPQYFDGSRTPELSPIEFAADVQRWFISIHPFGDGNGRTSRFVQDLIISSFDLPYTPSGRLGSDVYTTRENYRELNKDAHLGQIKELEACLASYEKSASTGTAKIPENCRQMYKGHDKETLKNRGIRAKFMVKLDEFLKIPVEYLK